MTKRKHKQAKSAGEISIWFWTGKGTVYMKRVEDDDVDEYETYTSFLSYYGYRPTNKEVIKDGWFLLPKS